MPSLPNSAAEVQPACPPPTIKTSGSRSENFFVALRKSNQFGASRSVPTSGISSGISGFPSIISSSADINVQAFFPSGVKRKTDTPLPTFVSKQANASIHCCPARSTSFGLLRRLSILKFLIPCVLAEIIIFSCTDCRPLQVSILHVKARRSLQWHWSINKGLRFSGSSFRIAVLNFSAHLKASPIFESSSLTVSPTIAVISKKLPTLIERLPVIHSGF